MSAPQPLLLAALRQAIGKPCPTNDALGVIFNLEAGSIGEGILALERAGHLVVERAGKSYRRITFSDGQQTDWSFRRSHAAATGTLRKCLCCSNKIFSTGPGHRMCDACKRDA